MEGNARYSGHFQDGELVGLLENKKFTNNINKL